MLSVLDYSELRLCHMDFVLQFLYSFARQKSSSGRRGLDGVTLCWGRSHSQAIWPQPLNGRSRSRLAATLDYVADGDADIPVALTGRFCSPFWLPSIFEALDPEALAELT